MQGHSQCCEDGKRGAGDRNMLRVLPGHSGHRSGKQCPSTDASPTTTGRLAQKGSVWMTNVPSRTLLSSHVPQQPLSVCAASALLWD